MTEREAWPHHGWPTPRAENQAPSGAGALTQGTCVKEGGLGATHSSRGPCNAAWESLSHKTRAG